MQVIREADFKKICDQLGNKDPHLRAVMDQYGYPPFWKRSAGFPTLIRIILEQQVSLQSAKAAYEKLIELTGKNLTPGKLLELTDKQLRACYFSRQKALYARELAAAIVSKKLILASLAKKPNDEVRHELIAIKGIGHWTIDIYLMMGLQRADIFPVSDLAAINTFLKLKQLPKTTPREEVIRLGELWKPYRSIATMILWHHYIRERNMII
jgi:DNA-3-methyladenine glycosylase II